MGGEIRALLGCLHAECEKLIARCEDLTAQNARLVLESADLRLPAGARKARPSDGAAAAAASAPSGGGLASTTRLVGDWDTPWVAAETRGSTAGQGGHFEEEMMGCLPSFQPGRISTSFSPAGRISASFSPTRRISASYSPAGRTASQPPGGARRSRVAARADSGAMAVGQTRSSVRAGVGPLVERLGRAERGSLDMVAEAQRQLAEEFALLKAQLGEAAHLGIGGATRVPKDTEELITRTRTGLKGASWEASTTCSRAFAPASDAEADTAGRLYYSDCRFPLLPVWESLAGNFQLLETRNSSDLRRKMIVMGDVKAEVDKELQSSSRLAPLIMSPVGWKRIIWNLLSMAMLSYDSLMLPMQLFDIQGDAIDAMEWTSLCFWSGDVAMTFFTGVYHDGRIDMKFSSIAVQYLQTWFIIDFLALAPDWIILTISAQKGATIGRLGKVLKTFRILRVLRLLRLLKFRGSFGWLMARISSEYTALCLDLLKIMVCILMANHYLACFWFYISMHSDEPWVASVQQDWGDDWHYFYVISYHWSISQLQGGMEVVAKTVLGRVYSIAVQLFALVATSMFISSVTNVMTQLQRLHQETFRRQRQMIRYLRDNHVSVELATRIKRFVCGLKGVNREKTEEVELLEALPEDLRVALKSEVYRPAIDNHSLLHRLSLASDGLRKDLCDTAIQKTAHLPSEVIFLATQDSESMFFVRSGSFSYTLSPSTFADELAEVDEGAAEQEEEEAGSTPTGFRTALRNTLQAARGRRAKPKDGRLMAEMGQCTCEMALWTMWLHRGDAVAEGCLELYSVHVEEFAESFRRWKKEEADIAVDYAKRYISWMNMEAASLLHDLSAPKGPLIS